MVRFTPVVSAEQYKEYNEGKFKKTTTTQYQCLRIGSKMCWSLNNT